MVAVLVPLPVTLAVTPVTLPALITTFSLNTTVMLPAGSIPTAFAPGVLLVTEGIVISFVAVGVVSAALTFPAASVAVTEGVTVPLESVLPSMVMSKFPSVAVPLPETVAPFVRDTLTVEPASAVPTTWIAPFSALLM